MRAFLCVVFLFGMTASVNAGVVANCDDDNDGAMTMDAIVDLDLPLNGGGEYELSMIATQHDYPAHMEGDFAIDGDPTVWIITQLTNDTLDFDWTDYHIAIGMPQSFTIVGALAPPNWSTVYNPIPTANQPLPGDEYHGDGYVGTIDFVMDVGGSPVAYGQSATFGFAVNFTGNVQFCTEQIPTPEPGSLALLACGGFFLLRRRR